MTSYVAGWYKAMEEATVKKEIIVKRLSAFKFAVEVNTKTSCDVRRQSVIQKAPPAKVEESPVKAVEAQTILIRQAILERIVEMLLCKLLGRARLEEFCGYPESSTCSLLSRVLRLSRPNNKSDLKVDFKCNGTIECFMERVNEFLKICAPTEQQWTRFGWQSLSGEAILRKIFHDELSPNMRSNGLEQVDYNLMKIYEDTKLLLQWEQQGFTVIACRSQRRENHSPNLWTYHNTLPSQLSIINRKVLQSNESRASEYLPRRYEHWKSAISMRQTHPLRTFPYPNGENKNWYMVPNARRGHHNITAKHL